MTQMNIKQENKIQTDAEVCDHGGRFFEALGDDFSHLERIGEIINADVLDAWFDPAPQVLESLREYLSWAVKTSPPTHSEGLVRTISQVRGIPCESILPSSGSSTLMYLALPALLPLRPKALLLNPTYGEYEHILKNLMDARISRFDLRREDEFQVRADLLCKTLSEGGFDFAVLVNPNSPTGRGMTRSQMDEIVRSLPASTLLWIDETYIEYVGREHSMESYAAAHPNVIVCKSMSKVYAMSGIRCAYLVAHPDTIRRLSRLAPPWSVSLIAQLAAVNALQADDYYQARYRETAEIRDFLVRGLKELPGARVYPGSANFVLCEFEGIPIGELLSGCRQRGLYLRNTENMGENWSRGIVRIAVKSREDTAKMLDILKDVLKLNKSSET